MGWRRIGMGVGELMMLLTNVSSSSLLIGDGLLGQGGGGVVPLFGELGQKTWITSIRHHPIN